MVPEKTGGTRWLPETNSEALESVYIAQVYLFSRDLSISGFEFEGQRVDNYAKPVGGVWSKKGFCRALPSQVLVRTGISYIGDGIKHGLSETREICSLVEILPEQAVGFLVGAALPWTVRVGEVDLDAGHLGKPFVPSHFMRPILGQAQTPLCADVL